jgi:plasmid stabilization system protein ParE
LKVIYTEEAIADLIEAITYLNERNPTAATNLDTEISRCIERLAAQEFEGRVAAAIGPARAKLGRPAVSPLLPAAL